MPNRTLLCFGVGEEYDGPGRRSYVVTAEYGDGYEIVARSFTLHEAQAFLRKMKNGEQSCTLLDCPEVPDA
jgi:hypothetical protein